MQHGYKDRKNEQKFSNFASAKETGMVKAVIFDIGGVLMDMDVERCSKSFKENCGLMKIDEFLDPCHQKGPISELEEGLISEREFYDKMESFSRPGTTDKQIEDSFDSLLRSIAPEKVELVKRLHKDYNLYLLSNNNSITMKFIGEEFARLGIPFETTFKELFISYQLKLQKPSRAIFEEVTRRCGCKAEEILFIDDSMSNVEGAQKAGLKALFYKVGTSLTDTVDAWFRSNASLA